MLARVILLSLLVLALSGCTSGPSAPPITSDHPASPEAAEVPLGLPSQTLATTNASAIPESNASVPQMQMDSGHDMSGMQHEMSNMPMPTTEPGAAAALSAPREAAASQPATTQAVVYTCVMHPEIISDKPGKCPKCGMTLVEKKQEGR